MHPSLTAGINIINRIIHTISIQVIAEQGIVQFAICTDKTSRVTVIIPAVQIVKPEVIVIVIAPVRERVILRRCRGSAIGVCYRKVAFKKI